MSKITSLIVGLSLLASSAVFAEEMDHSGMQMQHDGSMQMEQSSHMDSSVASSAYHNKMTKDGYDVVLLSEKALVSGHNEFYALVQKDGKDVADTKVRVKFFMPEMPGMPYMESKANGMKMGDRYKLDVNLGMGGTWQYHLEFKTSDGQVHKTRGSVNL